ncbi:glycosyl hydrolase family 71-domain-containing protein [Schizophyllum fasciatum]
MALRSLWARERDTAEHHHAVAQHTYGADGAQQSPAAQHPPAPPVATGVNATGLNATTFELEKRDGTKYVFMHHSLGQTLTRRVPFLQIRTSRAVYTATRFAHPPVSSYSYTQSTWEGDFSAIQATGVDAVALNLGSDPWQPGQLASAYAAAQAVGSLKLFLSFDYSSFACSVDSTVSLVNQFTGHPNQFKYNGKVFISSFLGGCLGNSGWQSIKTQTNGYLMPFIEGLEGKFDQWPSLDSWFCWGCSWPQGNYDKNTGDDDYYYGQLGSTPGRYAAGVSPWFFAHYGYKNQYYRGDDWLLNNRWDQLMAMRDRMNFVEIQTWNDWGESHYMGAIHTADQPAGTNWVNGYPHTAWMDMNLYYIQAFKSGAYPAVSSDVIYFWARPHPAAATASNDGLGRPTGYDWATDAMWAVVFSTGPATVTIRCGSSSNTTTVGAGITKLLTPLSPGQMTVTMVRGGQTVINYTPTDYTYVTNPKCGAAYRLNLYYQANVGSGMAGPTTSSTVTTTSSTVTTTTSTPIATVKTWKTVGCVQEAGSGRALAGASYTQSNMTPAVCQALCDQGSYTLAGTEYGNQCYCGNSYSNGATGAVVASSQCSSKCAGDSTQSCGGPYRLNVYQKS